jgi:hypothetical protein
MQSAPSGNDPDGLRAKLAKLALERRRDKRTASREQRALTIAIITLIVAIATLAAAIAAIIMAK